MFMRQGEFICSERVYQNFENPFFLSLSRYAYYTRSGYAMNQWRF